LQQVLAQVMEMMRLAKEGSQVGRDRVAELRDLPGAVRGQQLAIFGEAPQLQRTQAPRQAAVDQLALLIRKIDAGDLLDQAAQGIEIFVPEDEFPHAVG
jgi:hypothetical protein